MGSVYTRKGSRFLWLKYLQDGRVVRESSGTTNKSTARRMLRVREGDVERGIPIEPKVGRIFFDEAATDLLNDYIANGRRTHADTKRRIEKHLKPFFGDKRMSSITTSDIRAYVAKRQTDGWLVKAGRQADELGRTDSEPPTERRPVAAGEINRELTVLKRMFSLAMQAGKLRYKPHIPMLRENNVRAGFFEPEQHLELLQHLPEAFRPVVRFAYVTGWRINSEVLPLQWRQIDLKAGEVRLDPGTTKNREGRVFYFSAELRELLEGQRKLADRLQREKGMIVPHVFFH
nr:site-specific integrase [Acidobacteriota bacterium]